MNNVDDILIKGEANEKPSGSDQGKLSEDAAGIVSKSQRESDGGVDEKIKERPRERRIRSEVQKEIDPALQDDDVTRDRNPSLQANKADADSKDNEIKRENKEQDSKDDEKLTEEKEDSDHDEYGNKVTKQQKTYTQEEVEKIVKDRLSRGRHRNETPPTTEEKKVAAETGFEYDESSDKDWQVQLKDFIKGTFSEMNQEKEQKERKIKEERAQIDFEDKFNRGMGNYPDFVETLRDKPVTDAMVMATRAMENPAAFLYAAAKKFPDELAKIAALPDALQQATAMGRLEEKMKKPRGSTQASRPMGHDRSDVTEKEVNSRPSIESLINQHAKSKLRR